MVFHVSLTHISNQVDMAAIADLQQKQVIRLFACEACGGCAGRTRAVY